MSDNGDAAVQQLVVLQAESNAKMEALTVQVEALANKKGFIGTFFDNYWDIVKSNRWTRGIAVFLMTVFFVAAAIGLMAKFDILIDLQSVADIARDCETYDNEFIGPELEIGDDEI